MAAPIDHFGLLEQNSIPTKSTAAGKMDIQNQFLQQPGTVSTGSPITRAQSIPMHVAIWQRLPYVPFLYLLIIFCFTPHTIFSHPYPSKQFCFLSPHQPSRRLPPNSYIQNNKVILKCFLIPSYICFNPHTIITHPLIMTNSIKTIPT